MEHWKRTIERANRCFMAGELVDAREAYLQALALAQVLFERWADADEAVAACVISHHNLADLHLRLNQPEELKNLGIVIKRALSFITINGRFFGTRPLLDKPQRAQYQQLSLWGDDHDQMLTGAGFHH